MQSMEVVYVVPSPYLVCVAEDESFMYWYATEYGAFDKESFHEIFTVPLVTLNVESRAKFLVSDFVVGFAVGLAVGFVVGF